MKSLQFVHLKNMIQLLAYISFKSDIKNLFSKKTHIPIRSILSISASNISFLRSLSSLLQPHLPLRLPPDPLSHDIVSSRFLSCVYVHIPALCFHSASFHG